MTGKSLTWFFDEALMLTVEKLGHSSHANIEVSCFYICGIILGTDTSLSFSHFLSHDSSR